MQREDINPALQHPSSTYPEPRVVRPEHSENTITRVIEQQAAKNPLGRVPGALARRHGELSFLRGPQ